MKRETTRKALCAGLAAWSVIGAALPIAFAPLALAQETTSRFDVKAQSLDAALREVAAIAGVQVLYQPDIVAGRSAPALQGPLTVRAALDKLLDGTGLVVTQTGDRTYLVAAPSRAAQLQPASFSDDIVVTAQRRPEAGQKVPVAVTAYGEDAIDRLRLDNLRDVSRTTPGLLVSAFSYSSPTIAVRGATNTFTQLGANKPVQVVLDDVVIARNSAAQFDLFGLNSIQVLKGPQGTLFGRNVTGGAILIDTGRPEFGANGARVRATLGDYNYRGVEALADVGLGENLALRIAGSVKSRDGFGRDRLTGIEEDDLDVGSVRGQIRVRLNPKLEALVGVDYGDDRNNGRTLSSTTAGADGNRRTSELGARQTFARTQGGASVRLFADIFGGELTSITAYRQTQSGEVFSAVAADFRFLTGTQSQRLTRDTDHVDTTTQEVRWASPLWKRGNFIVGAFYLDEDAKRLLRSRDLRAVTGALVLDQTNDQTVKTKSIAVFVDGTLNFTDELSLTLGTRYTDDEKTASLVRSDAFTAAGNFSGTGLKRSWSEWTPRAVLSWKPLPSALVYGSWSKGFTAGGYNTDAATLSALTTPFAPETVTNREFGVKSDWFDRRLRANLTVFSMKYDDKQELFVNGVTRILNIVNASKATMEGYELESRLVVAPWLTLDGTWGRLDAKYDSFVIPGAVPTVNTGNRLGSSPKNKFSLGADARFPVGSWGEAFGTATYSSTSTYNTGAAADPNLQIPGYELINLSAGIGAADGKWKLTAFVRNAKDVDYILTRSTQIIRGEYLGEPRTAGVSFDMRF